jgi:hypothetical protein
VEVVRTRQPAVLVDGDAGVIREHACGAAVCLARPGLTGT